MKIVAISDTHTHHHDVEDLPAGDLLIHAGDFTYFGNIKQLADFAAWLEEKAKNYTYGAVVIAGNHDLTFDPDKYPNDYRIMQQVLQRPGIHYLRDEWIVLGGFKIWGSPVSPWFFDWAFNRMRGAEILKHWNTIPEDVDIIVTHGPVYGLCDLVPRSGHVGCEDMARMIKDGRFPKLKLHVSGHIHCAHGQAECWGVKFVNAALVDESYQVVNQPTVIEL